MVFSAIVPFLFVLLTALKTPPSRWWVVATSALIVPFAWFFRDTGFPASSEDTALWGLFATAAGCLALRFHFIVPALIRFGLIAALLWLCYPAWLAEEGGTGRKFLICFLAADCIIGASLGAELATAKSRLSFAALIPPAIGIAILLQLGGAMRFGQTTGAVAAVLAAFCVIILWKKPDFNKAAPVSAIAVSLIGLFALSGWLFAEIRWGLAIMVFVAPLLSWIASFLPLLNKSPFQIMLRDFIASALIVIPVSVIAISAYLAESAESEGY